MQIFLIILSVLLIIILSFLLTSIRVSAYLTNVENETIVVLKVYIFKFIRAFKLTKRMKGEKKKLSEKIEMLINYFFKSKADPVEYASREIKKNKGLPNFVRNIDIKKIVIEELDLNVKLDFGSAAISAIACGAANAIVGMVLAKYENNIKGTATTNIVPGYTGDGVKFKINAKVKMKVLDIIKLFFNK
ncbi:MAG: hypothetical protein IJS47_00130 [Clostridia bacterium]|nr:hypothetical protein [Clostridia bacterium]